LWDINKNNKSYSPINFYQKLNEINKSFILNKPNDSKDLLKFIFKQFHKELNTKTIKQNNKNNKTDSNFEKYDRAKTFNNFLKDFTNNNCSIISNNFYGITEINIECLKCKEFFLKEGIMMKPIIYDFKIYNMLIFPLEEIKTMKNKSNNKIKNNDKFSIYDCFEFLRNKNHNEGKNIFCKRCNQLSEVINISKLFNAPNILIIILNRGKGNAYNMKIEFDEVIDVTDYIEYKQNKVIYNLYGVVTHLGKNGDEGHFIAICKNLIDNTWYKYNDSDINIIKNIKKEILEFGKPYILSFQKSF
jgi:ubiquitin C-terminal hydrolase